MLPVFSSPVVTIIHCGAKRVTVAVFSRKARRLHWASCSTVTLAEGSGDVRVWVENTCAALRTLQPAAQSPRSAVLVLPPQVTLLKHLRMPRVDERKRARMVEFEAGQNIPCALGEVVWDGVPSGGDKTTQGIFLAAAKRNVIEPLCAAARAAGFEPSQIVPASAAVLAACRTARPLKREAELLLCVGAGDVTLLQMAGPGFAVRAVSLGGEGEATLLASRLAHEVTRSVVYFQRQCGLPDPVRLLLAGEGAIQATIGPILSQRLNIPVENIDLTGNADVGDVAKQAVGTDTLVELSGAAAMQLDRLQPLPNLLPPRLRTQHRRQGRRPWLVAAALLALAAPVGPLVRHHQLEAEARLKLAVIEAVIAPLRASEARIRTQLTRRAEIERQISVWRDVRKRRTAWMEMLADLEERLNRVENVWFDGLQVVPVMDGAPMRLTVSGRMLDRADSSAQADPGAFARLRNLLAVLGESPYFATVEAERIESGQPGLLTFDLVLVTGAARPL